jgi:protein-tyrosine phosphatase
MAEAIFRQEVKRRGLEPHFEIDSCGTGSYHIGELPDYRARATLTKMGLNTEHRARQFKASDFELFDYILPQDESNLQNMLKLKNPAKEYSSKVFKMRHFDPQFENEDVPDPYFGGEEGFDEVYEMLVRSSKHLLDHILYEHPELNES